MDLVSTLTLAFIAYGLVCPVPALVNKSAEPWTAQDKQILVDNMGFCKRHFNTSVCIKQFVKRAPLTYHIICGPKERP